MQSFEEGNQREAGSERSDLSKVGELILTVWLGGAVLAAIVGFLALLAR